MGDLSAEEQAIPKVPRGWSGSGKAKFIRTLDGHIAPYNVQTPSSEPEYDPANPYVMGDLPEGQW